MRLKFEKDTNIGARTIGTDACVFLIGQARSAGMSAMPESGSEPEGVAFSRVTNGAHRFQAGVLGDMEGWFDFLAKAEIILRQYGDIPFVHWHHYERTHIDAYVQRYGDPAGKHRSEGSIYHTRSRGIPRWKGNEFFVFLRIEIWLFLFNCPIGVLFAAGYCMNAKLKSEQNAAIMSRYLDKMDADIENLYLEDAALGKCPTEITYLNHPLDPNMNPEVRKSVAASLVGKPVLGIHSRSFSPRQRVFQTVHTPAVQCASGCAA